MDWLVGILELEQKSWANFLGQTVDLTQFRNDLLKYGKERIDSWRSLGLEPHHLFKLSFMPDDEYPGWEIKPEIWFYQKIKEGKIFRDINGELEKVLTVDLDGITVLIDTRLKPAYQDDRQMWDNDNLLGDIIEKLRKEKKIAKYNYGPQSSRFGVSADVWQEHISPALTEKLGLNADQVRLERAIEMNVIPQIFPYMPRAKDGETSTWVWLEEYSNEHDDRLDGGCSGLGGLADVRFFWAGDHWRDRSFRPLAVL